MKLVDMRPTLYILFLLLLPAVVVAQPVQSEVIVVHIRVLSPSDPADRFEILDAVRRNGVAPRPQPIADPDAIAAASPEVRLLDDTGRIIHRQPFTWSRVRTVPPVMPGTTNNGAPNYVVIERPETSVILPAVVGAARVEIAAATTTTVAATRSIASLSGNPSARDLGNLSPPPATPGTLNILLLASGFSESRIALFPGIAAGIQAQLLNAEPFRSNSGSIAIRTAQATRDLGCNPRCNGIDRLMCCSESAVIDAAADSRLPFDEIVVVHDTATYSGSGGRDSGGYRSNSFASYTVVYNGEWTEEMVQHEFGHSFGDLCDEYTYINEPYRYRACANCRPTCSELSPFGACSASCDAAPSYFRPDDSIMLALNIPTFNQASIDTTTPVDGLSTRLNYFAGATAPPATPTGLQAQTTANSVTVSWNPALGATGYTLQAGRSSEQYTLFNGPVGNTTSVSSPIGSGTYFWRVLATNGAGNSPPSAEAQFTIGAPVTIPSTPTGLTSQINGNAVTLSWSASTDHSAPLSPATSYTLQVGTTSGQSNLFNGTVGNTTTISGNVGNGSYFWRVVAVNSAGSSPASSEAQFAVGCTVAPGAPQNFAFTMLGRLVTLTWAAPTTGGTPSSYVVEAGSASGLANLATIPAGAATSLSAQAPPGTFFVRVRAQNGCGTSPASNEQLIAVH